jgi:hypothetical protein
MNFIDKRRMIMTRASSRRHEPGELDNRGRTGDDSIEKAVLPHRPELTCDPSRPSAALMNHRLGFVP